MSKIADEKCTKLHVQNAHFCRAYSAIMCILCLQKTLYSYSTPRTILPTICLFSRFQYSGKTTAHPSDRCTKLRFPVGITRIIQQKDQLFRVGLLYFSGDSRLPYNTISKVPAPMSTHPSRDFTVNCSCRKMNASRMVMTTDSLSTGTTFDASPICSALK